MEDSINKLKGDLEKLIKKEIQGRIKQLGLVKTGRLFNSIKVRVVVDKDGYDIEVDAVDYFDILDEEHDILDYVLNLNSVDDIMTDLFAEMSLEEFMEED